MSSNTTSNITTFIALLTAIIAAIPPILTIASEITIRLRILTKRNKRLSPKIVKIIRTPLSIDDYKKVKKRVLNCVKITFLCIIFFIVNTILYRLGYKYLKIDNEMIIGEIWGFEVNLIVITNVVFFIVYFVAFIKAYKRMGSHTKDIKYFLFEEALLHLECDFENAVNHCMETFRLLGARVIEIDLEKGIIEAYTIDNMVHIFGGLYEIKIREEEENYNFDKTIAVIRYHPKIVLINDKVVQSSSMNKFIRVFSN